MYRDRQWNYQRRRDYGQKRWAPVGPLRPPQRVLIHINYDSKTREFLVQRQYLATNYLEGLMYGQKTSEGTLKLHILEVIFIKHQYDYLQRLRQRPNVVVRVEDEMGKELTFDDLLYKIGPRHIQWPLTKYLLYSLVRTAGFRWSEAERMNEKCFVQVLMDKELPFYGGRGCLWTSEEGITFQPPKEAIEEDFSILWFSDDKMGVITNPKVAEALTKIWIGTIKYKVKSVDDVTDQNLKLDSLELLYVLDILSEAGKEVKVIDTKSEQALSREKIVEMVRKEWPKFDDLYAVYRDWRSKGYGSKAAVLFGAQLRIYAVGSSPFSEEAEYVHSLYLVNTVKKEDTITPIDIISAGRLSRTVRKASMWGITNFDPSKDTIPVTFDVSYWTPGLTPQKKEMAPMYLAIAVPEHASLSLQYLASIYEHASRAGVQPVLCLVDRERSCALYLIKRILLKGSPNYYLSFDFFTVDDILPKLKERGTKE